MYFLKTWVTLGLFLQKKDKPNQGKKNNKQKGGILLNKSEPVLVKQESAQEINHFEEIHPKDALEIARQHVSCRRNIFMLQMS